jgi:hypothetical protein
MVGSSSNADGVILYAPNPASPLMRISAEGGTPVAVTALEPGQAGHAFPHFLPDGRHFLYSAFGRPDARGVYVGRLDDPLKQRLLETDSPTAYVDGHLYFLEKGGVFAQAFDAATRTLVGRPLLVADGVLENLGYFLTFSVAGNGTIAFRTGTASRARQFAWFDRAGRVLSTVGEAEFSNASNPSPSPDGTQLAVFRRGQGGSDSDVWLVETRRGVMTRFTTTPGEDIFPSWSRDGTRIAFTSNRNRDFAIYAKSLSTGAEDLLVPGSPEESFANDWSPDGRVLIWQRRSVKSGWDLWALPLGGGTSSAILQTESDERDAQFSPDGRWIAYCSNASGRFEVYVRPFAGGVSTPVSTMGGAQPRWRADGRELFYIGLDGRLMVAGLATLASGAMEVQAPAALFPARVGRVVVPGGGAEYIPSPDGSRILMNTIVQDPGPAPIRLVLNWKPPAS